MFVQPKYVLICLAFFSCHLGLAQSSADLSSSVTTATAAPTKDADEMLATYAAENSDVTNDTDSLVGRTPVTNTRAFPYNVEGLILIDRDGTTYGCTGTLVARNIVLAAAHCFHDENNVDKITYGGWFYPGKNNATEEPYGKYWITSVTTPNGYKTSLRAKNMHDKFAWDIALGYLSAPVTSVGYRGASSSIKPNQNEMVFVIAYHQDEPRGTMWQETCFAGNQEYVPGRTLSHSCTLAPHASGSPVIYKDVIVGVNAATNPNIAVRLTNEFITAINQGQR